MATAAQTLRELHRLHVHLRSLKAEIDEGPSLFKAQQAKLTRTETALKVAQDHLKHLKVTTHEKEVELRSTHQQIAKYEKQLNEAGAKKEYDALQHEIATCRQTCARLEDEILALLAEIDDTTQKLPGLDATLKQVRDETAGLDKEAQERIARLTADLQETTVNLAEAEKQVAANVRPLYERLVAAHGADAIAAVHDKTCSICYSTVTAQQMRELEAGVVSLCKNCGRLLFLAQ